jgi:hypothetical protein
MAVSTRPDPRLTRHLKDLYPTLEQLLEAAEAVRGLLAEPGWPVLQSVLHAEIAEIDRLLDGSERDPLTRAQYAGAHGRRGALMAPEQSLRALIDHAERELEEQRRKHESDAEPSRNGR